MRNKMLIMLVVLFCSCNEKYDFSTTKKIKNTLTTLNRESNLTNLIKKIFILDLDAGCESCIDETLKFASKKQQNSNLLFIIVSAHKNTLKHAETEYALKIISTNSILVDSNLVAFKNGLVDVFPKVFYFKNGKVIDHTSIDASNIEKLLSEN